MTVIVGAGPVGLFAALAFARRGPVTLVARRAVPVATTRIDTVPLGLLGLLVEFGIPPARIGASASNKAMLVAWDTAEPVAFPTPAKAHIDRHLLELELWRKVDALKAVTVTDRPSDVRHDKRRCIDATGRAAWSAIRAVHPPVPWFARTFVFPGRFGEAQQALRIAASPGGYVYRSALPDLLTLGFVGPRGWLRDIGTDALSGLDALGLGWMAAGLSPVDQRHPGRGGAASAQWTQGEPGIDRIGDANLACDALSSQGIALGMSDALALARGRSLEARVPAHLAHLRTIIARCQFSRSTAWRDYDHFLKTSSEDSRRAMHRDHEHADVSPRG